MAEEQKPVEVAPAVESVAETKIDETPAATTEAAPEAATESAAPATETSEAAPAFENTPLAAAINEAAETETKPEEAVKTEEPTPAAPVEEGHLEVKGTNFPKNFLYSKKFFWFGSEPVDTKSISTFKADKAADVAHHIHAWAAETGKGLLFFSEKSDKAAPHGAIHLAESSEPVVEGTNKFHFTTKGHKHTFKASSTAERDNWVSQLKAKIAEAKELATTVTESETYKKTLESFKPAPVAKKEETPVVAAVAEPTTTEAVATEEAPVEAEPVVPTVEEPKKEEVKKEEPKRRSASRKRTSIFGGSLFGKKDEKKTEAPVAAETEAVETEAPAATETATETAVVAEETPAAETTAVVATEPAPEVTPAEVPVIIDETKAEEPKAEEKPVKATASKRGSIFSNLSFGKKRATSPQPAPAAVTPVEETPAATTEAVAETAPVIPAVETTEPLSTEVASPATVPTETVDATPATNGETVAAKEVKSEKRKSSLPFGFGKKDKTTSGSDDEEKVKSPSAFSKLRQTIKGKATPKATEAPAEKATEDKAVEAEPTTTEAPKEEEVPKAAEPEVPAPVAEEAAPVEKPLAATPVISTAA